ncbi:pyridoxal 5'-phosphate synthase glutaminase subunit PdxT [Caldivirga maquilingensis]|uniref:Pyridoxal 5'-phosphate synthase subunit PdxT n=1 Tax=Caldivirga maquilingensis (strain ATCC 700844 / DSM 13496 / JCM 10307 / IC-167) TaxID=397948 RepID=PDXT_CALMQ|nr:pyridoxal 5'-phosphate synthase glutaminase subunit PdxT [Caldivirga maquilingensis]A8MAY1.1 RecName: Full=Pyridoxal 5'-phosphate synthase subunit PdxT; AltName: Full=Pdx2; AltName: Full=Pyridoxal 5'-phosphate synthase glutaminase subunit [Caldivirga maquilingensis IC-167]ABW02610.1 SNO glutamine amidotransferase [Caldivirga maquilingensis IC-167]
MKIGILAVQGDVEEHEYAVKKAMDELGISGDVARVKRIDDLRGLSGIIIPGGESTSIWRLTSKSNLMNALRDEVSNGLPAMGTCAGAIFMAREVKDRIMGETGQGVLGIMNISVVRNFYGRQRESFETTLNIEGIGTVRAVFIRAPAIVKYWGSAKPLVAYGDNYPVVIENNMLALTFHPELTTILVHEWFISNLVKK